jgi:methylenetetrahydrofolate dehydrogenase (NADP+) / methenyltetrahydrofolate cyclohydrolase
MADTGIIDGRAILSSCVTRMQSFSPRLSQATVTVVIPDPLARGADAALVSARQKQKTFRNVGFDFREVRAEDVSRLAPRMQEFAIIQRPLDAKDILARFKGPVVDLESVVPEGTVGELSGTAEAALRILESLPWSVRQRYSADPVTAIVGSKGYFGSQVVRAVERWGKSILTIDEGDDLAQLRSADVVVSAVGKPGLIKPEFLREKTLLLIDVGYFYDENTGVGAGDFDEAAYRRSTHFVPTPGGMGPLQILTLLERALRAMGIQGYEPWSVDLTKT